ncbi:MAG TPA: vWA domain-containing protein [Polyangia bacterium]|nr:vWA domain-containing protein [Polyangia bacterium]
MQRWTHVLWLTATLALGCSSSGISGGSTTGAGNSGSGNPSGGGGNGTGTPVTDPGKMTCGMRTFGLQKVPPDLLIVQDKSGSMDESPDGTCRRINCAMGSKWVQMTAAINQVVGQTQASIRWGLSFFPADRECGVAAMPAVPIADMNAMPIAGAIAATMPNGATPTAAAVAGASMYLATLADPNPKYILLATDGLPNCMGGVAGANDPDGAIQAVTDSAKNGIPVFVVGIGNIPEGTAELTSLAVAGGRPQAADPKYYPVSSTADLASVLTTIGGMIGSCAFGLGGAPPDPAKILVAAGGTKIPNDPTHMNGWDYGTGNMSIQLFGSWCDQAKAGTLKDLQATFGCPPPVVK